MGQLNTYNLICCKDNEGTERTNYILDSLSTEYTPQAFSDFYIFRHMCSTTVNNPAS